MNSGVNASLRFAFTTIVEKGAFYNTKQVRKESKGVCLSKGVKSKKGCLFIKRCQIKERSFVYQKGVIKERCQIKERVYMKKGKGGKEKQNEYQNTIAKEGDVITKPIPKQYKNKSYTKTNYNKKNTNTNKRI